MTVERCLIEDGAQIVPVGLVVGDVFQELLLCSVVVLIGEIVQLATIYPVATLSMSEIIIVGIKMLLKDWE